MRARAMVRAALAILAVASLGGCGLFEDLPDRSCKSNQDCFAAQGETCDTSKNTCVAGPDAAPTPIAPPLATPVVNASSVESP